MENQIIAKVRKIKDVLEQNLQIPHYQRPYRWRDENVRLLLQDIYESWKGGKRSYRIGSVILHVKDYQTFHIVDGQQRVVTILIILKILQNNLGASLRKSLVFEHGESKNNIVQNNIIAIKWINDNVGNERDEFSKYLTEYCEFVEIKVHDLSEAFQMFDSQNGRGKELEPYNLLKAYHIRAMSNALYEYKVLCDRRWESATRHKTGSHNGKDKTYDVLNQVINEQLYRTRVWSRLDAAFAFNKNKIREFKGTNIDKETVLMYPFQNSQLLDYMAVQYISSMGLLLKGIKNRFINGDSDNINPFVLINQNIINGKQFFDFIETYVEFYRRIFLEPVTRIDLPSFREFYNAHCFYQGSNRDGDRYLKELYKSLIFSIFDKYGEEGVNKYYIILYALVYRIRLNKKQVRYDTVAKYPQEEGIFSIIERSKSYLDLQPLEQKAIKPIDCRYEEPNILQFYFNQGIIISTNDSKIDLNKYKRGN